MAFKTVPLDDARDPSVVGNGRVTDLFGIEVELAARCRGCLHCGLFPSQKSLDGISKIGSLRLVTGITKAVLVIDCTVVGNCPLGIDDHGISGAGCAELPYQLPFRVMHITCSGDGCGSDSHIGLCIGGNRVNQDKLHTTGRLLGEISECGQVLATEWA